MALANFIDRAATAASQVLAGFQLSAFKNKLEAQKIGIAFDGSGVRSPEGEATLDLLVRLLARLYPTLAIRALDPQAGEQAKQLRRLAKSINPKISLPGTLRHATACVVVGGTRAVTACPTFFVGSEAWRAKLSCKGPVDPGASVNPFGAGAAACFAAANVFRTVFGEQLAAGEADQEIDLSLLTYAQNGDRSALDLSGIDVGETHLVGLGAIGSGAVWALARAPGLTGTLHLVDHQTIDLSNLQRYVLAGQVHIDGLKVDLVESVLRGTGLEVIPHPMDWSSYVGARQDWRFERIAVALDSAADRIAVQGALPKWIVNAWTQDIDLGVSRHGFDDGRACLACLYLPTGKVRDEHVHIAEELKIPDAALHIRTLLQTSAPVDEAFVRQVATTFAVPFEQLSQFVGQPVRSFHQGAICGGLMMRLTDGAQPATAVVPMAFQSALAGIMLAADLVKHASGSNDSPATSTRINLLRPLAPYLHDPQAKDTSGRCICTDPDFQLVYRKKYQVL